METKGKIDIGNNALYIYSFNLFRKIITQFLMMIIFIDKVTLQIEFLNPCDQFNFLNIKICMVI